MTAGHGETQLVAPELPRVKPADVVAIVQSDKPTAIVLDVRKPEERAAGSIKGSLNVPASVFQSEDTAALDEVIKSQLLTSGAQEVIVHCHFSQVRGPTCAKALSERIKALGVQGPEVKVLSGGIVDFMNHYQGDSSLVDVPEGGWKAD